MSSASVVVPCGDAAILDTNVVLAWLVFRDPRVAPLDAALRAGQLHWLCCTRMLEELDHVLGRAPLAGRAPDRSALQREIEAHVQLVEAPAALPARPGLRCTDRDDQIFIELALAQRAPLLLTRDRALLKLARKAALHGVRVTTPERWAAPPTATAAAAATPTPTPTPTPMPMPMPMPARTLPELVMA
jgi:predicted nucleic acid-binding protein